MYDQYDNQKNVFSMNYNMKYFNLIKDYLNNGKKINKKLVEDYDSKNDNALEWLGDTSYLVLYHGVLYCWDVNVQTVLFCNYILHYGNTSHLLSVRQFYKNQSIVFVVYQSSSITAILSYNSLKLSAISGSGA